MLEMDLKLFRQITNVNTEVQGISSGSESGVAIMQKKQSAFMGNEIIFQNFSTAKIKLGNILVKLMQDVYADNPDRIYRILSNDYTKSQFEVPVNGQMQDWKSIPYDYVIAKLKDLDLTKYDITIDLSAESQSYMLQNYLLLKELAASGIPIPPEIIVRNLPISEKDEMLTQMKNAQQQAMQQQQAAIQAQMPKQQPQM